MIEWQMSFCFAFALSEPFSIMFFSLPFIITAHGVIQNCLFKLIDEVIVLQPNNRYFLFKCICCECKIIQSKVLLTINEVTLLE